MPITNVQALNVGINGAVGFTPIRIKQHDKNTRRIEITLLEGSDIFEIPNGAVAKFQATKPDGKIILDDCSIENGTVIYNATEQLAAYPGIVKCEVALYNSEGDELLQSSTFDILVDKSSMDRNTVTSSDEFKTLTIMINTITGLVENATIVLSEIETAISNTEIAISNTEVAINTANQATTNAQQATAIINTTNQTMIDAENIRIASENTRKSNETTRQSQEGTRQANTSTAITNADTATARANLAAKSCEDIASGIIEMPDIGVPGTYSKVTTDVKGRVVSGDSPTDIADLGITDVYTKSEIDTKTDTKLDKTSVVNNLVTTLEGTVLDGRQGKALSDKIGTLSNLTTASKTDLVGSVNEVKASVDGDGRINVKYPPSPLVGAVGNGIADDTNALINIITNNQGKTIYFPKGTYCISSTLNISGDYQTSLLFDNAELKALASLEAMIIIGDRTGVNYNNHPQTISGTGVINMNSVAKKGIETNGSKAYIHIKDIQIRNNLDGIGIQIGHVGQESLSAQHLIDNVGVYGVDSKYNSTGIKFVSKDCILNNSYIYIHKTGIIASGGNMLNNVHIWGHSYETVDYTEVSTWIGIELGSNALTASNLYLDALGTGINFTTGRVNVGQLIFMSDFDFSMMPNELNVLKCDYTARCDIASLQVISNSNYITNILKLNSETTTNNYVSQRRFKINHNTDVNTQFNILNEAFNICYNKYTTTLTQSSGSLDANKYYLLGYIRGGAGMLEMYITLKTQYYNRFLLLTDSSSIILSEQKLYKPSSVTGAQYYIGNPITYNTINFFPLYFIRNTSSSFASFEINCNALGETGFYPFTRGSITQFNNFDTISPYLELPINNV